MLVEAMEELADRSDVDELVEGQEALGEELRRGSRLKEQLIEGQEAVHQQLVELNQR